MEQIMDVEKYKRSVALICPTCGHDQFEHEGIFETAQSIKCEECQREFTRDELIETNSENVSEHVDEMKKEIAKDLAKELKDTLRKTLSGSKSIKLR
jgi:transposase-like protein